MSSDILHHLSGRKSPKGHSHQLSGASIESNLEKLGFLSGSNPKKENQSEKRRVVGFKSPVSDNSSTAFPFLFRHCCHTHMLGYGFFQKFSLSFPFPEH
jgi:hypothetical protein